MRDIRRGLLGVAASLLLVTLLPWSRPVQVRAAAAPQALAYVSNGQVQVFEAGSLTTAGPGQNPVWSPNGANLLFMHVDYVAGTADLFVADSHGANVKTVGSGAYPYIQPAWSSDSKAVVYAALQAGTTPTANRLPLEIRSLNPLSRAQRVLAKVTITGGCMQDGTAQQVAASMAQGSYRGIPSTLILARSGMLIVQASCTGSGLLLVPLKGKVTTLPSWSSGVLSPDGSTLAAVVTDSKSLGSRIGLLSIASLKTTIFQPRFNATLLTWSRDGSALLAVAEPTNTANGNSQIFRISKDGKTVLSLGLVPGSGVYHPSVDHTGKSLAIAVIAGAAAKVAAIPPTTIDLLSTQLSTQAHAFFVGTQPSWRP